MTTTEPATLRLDGALSPADAPRLCAQLSAVARPGATVLLDLGAVQGAGLGAVEVLARLRLTAGRLDCRLLARNAGPELRALLGFLGLAELADPPP